MKVDFEELSVENLGGERTAQRFSHELQRLIDDLTDPDCAKNGMSKGQIAIIAEFSFNQESQALTYGVRVARKSPNVRAYGQALQLIDGRVHAQVEEQRQTTLSFVAGGADTTPDTPNS